MRYNPEAILQQSALDAPTATAFLAENYTSFIADRAVDDVAAAAGYLSDAGGWRLGAWRGAGWRVWTGAEVLLTLKGWRAVCWQYEMSEIA